MTITTMAGVSPEDAKRFGEMLRDARDAVGAPRDSVCVHVRELLGIGRGLSVETLRLFEAGDVGRLQSASPIVLLGLCRILNVAIDDVPTTVRARFERVHLIFSSPPDEGTANTAWALVGAGQAA